MMSLTGHTSSAGPLHDVRDPLIVLQRGVARARQTAGKVLDGLSLKLSADASLPWREAGSLATFLA